MTAEKAGPQPSHLAQIVAATQAGMLADFAKIKAAFTHNTLKGNGGEALVALFLRERLPDSVGAVAGQVVDSTGAISKQVDVVLYDKIRTPMLFASPNETEFLIPVEGVLAVIEVKTHLTSTMLPGILESCRTVKELKRSAYIDSAFGRTYQLYGQTWQDMPIHYSVFAAKSDNVYSGTLNDLQVEVPLASRIDTLCYLDRGVTMNASVESLFAGKATIAATSSPGSVMVDVEREDGLLLWYGALASQIVQAETRPIRILDYMPTEATVSATAPQGAAMGELKSRLMTELADHVGVDPGVLERFENKTITVSDIYELFRLDAYVMPDGAGPIYDAARSDAKALTYEEWQERWGDRVVL